MKTLLRALFVAFLVFMGIQLYSCTSQRTYQRELVKAGNIAYKEGDFSLFKEIFVYYQDKPYVDESIVLIDKDNRPNIESRDIYFDLTVFLQAEKDKNHITVILSNLEMENVEYSLKTVVKKDGGEKVLEENLFRLSENNWYIQYFEFDSETIDQLIITHVGISSVEPIILYDSSDTFDVFLSKENNDLVEAIKEDKLEENGIIKREKDPFAGKGASVYIVMAVYILISGVLIYAIFFNKTKTKTAYKKDGLNSRKESINNQKTNNNENKQ